MKIVCILGKSGSGKSSIERNLNRLGFNRIISYTTREKRDSEQDGVEYHFITRDQFEKMIKLDAFMEYAVYSGNYYGSAKPIGSINNVIVVESVGFKAIKDLYKDQATGVYIDVDTDTSTKRAYNRSMESGFKPNEEEIQKRVKEDELNFKDIKESADLIVDGNLDTETQTAIILEYILNQKN